MQSTGRLIALVTAALLGACQNPGEAPSSQGAEAMSADPPSSTSTAQAVGATEAATTAPGITPIVALDSIGATKEFLERTLGESTYETPDEARYTVDGCDVSVGFHDRAVSMISIDLQEGCRFDVSGLTGTQSDVVVDGPLTFGEFEQLFGEADYRAPCLASCGNAYDPYVDAVVGGSRANGVIDVSAHSVFVNDSVIQAANEWRDELTAERGEDYVFETQFNCTREHNAVARRIFARIEVHSLQFGRELGTYECG